MDPPFTTNQKKKIISIMLTIRLHKVMPAIMLQLNLKEEAIKII
ncbi:MAG: hypothetical protein ACK5NI_01285 [bacterium]